MTMPAEEQRTLRSLLAAIEYVKIHHRGIAGQTGQEATATACDAIWREMDQDEILLDPALATVAVRAAHIAASLAGVTVEQLLESIEEEFRSLPPGALG